MKNQLLLLFALTNLSILITNEISAQAGALDGTFNSTGIVTHDFGNGDDFGSAIEVQADGKILVAGYTFNGSDKDIVLMRYNSSGTLDNTFGTGGITITAVGTTDDVAADIEIQTDGKIIVGGRSKNGTYNEFALLRYNTDGTLDNTFDSDGKVTTALSPFYNELSSIDLQADGKIVATGITGSAANYDFYVARYNTDGSLDNTFSSDGIATTAVGTYHDYSNSVKVQSDGKILVAGSSLINSINDFTMVRFNSNGTLDNTFDSDGKVVTDINGASDNGWSVHVQSDGKYLFAGYGWNGSNADFAVVRYNTDGSLDVSFDGDGKVLVPVGAGTDNCWNATLQSDDKILLVGQAHNGSNFDYAVLRFNTDGSLDNSFDSDGRTITPIGSADDIAVSVAVQPDGKIVATGRTHNGTDFDFGVVRYLNAPMNIDESTEPLPIHLFPNPSQGLLNIGYTDKFNTLKIIDINGNVILVANGEQKTFDVSNLDNGMYFLELSSEKLISRQKFILQK